MGSADSVMVSGYRRTTTPSPKHTRISRDVSHPLPGTHPTDAISAGSTPSAVGHGVAAPLGWGWVSKYIGMVWPTGDSAKLRSAAATWTNAGTNFEVSEIIGATGPMSSIAAQQIPEGPAIAAAFSEAHRCAAGILQQCTAVATHLTSYATKIDAVHAAIIDLLSRICNPLTGIKEVWEFLTDEDEDEIRKIANDIRIIVNQFTSEVDALCQEIATALSEAATIISTMARYAEKEWDHFLHATDAGRILDHVGQIGKGAFTEAEGFVKSVWTLSPVRAVVDPKGFWHSVSDAVDKLESLTGLDGEQRFKDSWKELGKDTVHWDEWSTNPFQAAGESAFDVGMLLLTDGGSELPLMGRVAAGATKELKGLTPPEVRPPLREPAPPRDIPAPQSEPPKGGQPEPAPKPKTALPPYGLTESKTPIDQKAPATTSKQVVEPVPAGHPPPSPPTHATTGPAGTPPPLPDSPAHGGSPNPYTPPSPAHDHHGSVAQAPQPLTSEDLSALNNYTGLGHDDLNDALRTGTLNASQHARVEALNLALEKLPPHSGLVYRGTDLPPEVLSQYQPGSVVTEDAFVSTSVDPAVARSPAFAGNVEFRIVSKTGREISSLSLISHEQEVLFPSGMQFYVLTRTTDPLTGTTIIEMAER